MNPPLPSGGVFFAGVFAKLQNVPYRTKTTVCRLIRFIMTSESRIRQLCAQAVAAKNPEELSRVVLELQIALHVHCEKLKTKLADYHFDLTRASTKPKKAA